MNAHFYLNNEEKTEIFTLYNIHVAPYNEGDTIFLSVDELRSSDYNLPIG